MNKPIQPAKKRTEKVRRVGKVAVGSDMAGLHMRGVLDTRWIDILDLLSSSLQ